MCLQITYLGLRTAASNQSGYLPPDQRFKSRVVPEKLNGSPPGFLWPGPGCLEEADVHGGGEERWERGGRGAGSAGSSAAPQHPQGLPLHREPALLRDVHPPGDRSCYCNTFLGYELVLFMLCSQKIHEAY